MKGFNKLAMVAISLAVLAPGAVLAQIDAEVPFAMQDDENPNILFFIDNTGYMNRNVDGRNRIQVVRDVMAGTLYPITYEGKQVYVPHHEPVLERIGTTPPYYLNPGENWVGDDVAAAMPLVYRMVKDNEGNFMPNFQGPYFAFYGPDDIALGATVTLLLRDSLVSFDAYMRERVSNNIELANPAGNVKLDDGSLIQREIWISTGAADSDLTYSNALYAYWDYYETGIIHAGTAGVFFPGDSLVVPVVHTPVDPNYDWTGSSRTCLIGRPPTAVPPKGLCYYNISGGQFEECYKPTASSPAFVFFDRLNPFYRDTAQELTNNKQTFQQWSDDNGSPQAYCSAGSFEIWGDANDESTWLFDRQCQPYSDGNMEMVEVFVVCGLTAPGAIPLSGGTFTEDRMIDEILAALPEVEPVDALSVYDGVTVTDEFLKYVPPDETCSGSCVRIDLYIRGEILDDITKEGLIPGFAWPDESLTNLLIADPWFGGGSNRLSGTDGWGYFDFLYYNNAYIGTPGIMDQYPNVNYGLMRFDNINKCDESNLNGATADDFPPTRAGCAWALTSPGT